jgi:hypothetical protein
MFEILKTVRPAGKAVAEVVLRATGGAPVSAVANALAAYPWAAVKTAGEEIAKRTGARIHPDTATLNAQTDNWRGRVGASDRRLSDVAAGVRAVAVSLSACTVDRSEAAQRLLEILDAAVPERASQLDAADELLAAVRRLDPAIDRLDPEHRLLDVFAKADAYAQAKTRGATRTR